MGNVVVAAIVIESDTGLYVGDGAASPPLKSAFPGCAFDKLIRFVFDRGVSLSRFDAPTIVVVPDRFVVPEMVVAADTVNIPATLVVPALMFKPNRKVGTDINDTVEPTAHESVPVTLKIPPKVAVEPLFCVSVAPDW